MGIIAKPLSYLLIWLYDLVGSYGIAILILNSFDQALFVSTLREADRNLP